MTKRRNNILMAAFLVTTLSLCFAGCGKNEATAPPPKPAPPKPAVKQVLPVQKQVSSAGKSHPANVASDFASYKDPFKPLVSNVRGGVTAVKKNRLGQVLPILNYDLSQFRVTGIIVGMRQNTAQVMDPTGRTYIVKTGMEIGRNEGKITRITPSYVEVFEQYRDETGKLVKNNVRLALPKK